MRYPSDHTGLKVGTMGLMCLDMSWLALENCRDFRMHTHATTCACLTVGLRLGGVKHLGQVELLRADARSREKKPGRIPVTLHRRLLEVVCYRALWHQGKSYRGVPSMACRMAKRLPCSDSNSRGIPRRKRVALAKNSFQSSFIRVTLFLTRRPHVY